MSILRRQAFWNLPNSLTVLRIFLVPMMVVLLWDDPSIEALRLSWIIFVGAMITDIIDGWLARRWNLTSAAGAYLDPMADKLMVATTLIMMVERGWVSGGLAALLLCREIAITGLRGIASQEGMVISASTLGKFKTSFQGTALGMMLWGWWGFGAEPRRAGLFLLYIATFFSLASALEYLMQFFQQGAAQVKAEDQP
ncbi:MAG: CDP-diacylglycerol--glycerol-3-phosphate 3-phosphatidyltransferase [Deltaproteobacteria bacterium]|nr:CDP-diacylglycerol--glycerol-3-phosphate 3-phosphatidyltransferase [Deltaproteobacteria bacterium]HCH63393.1 CDP-diacylglycerol--glycerol-3-phosphate 3-phosphatidyltransferase [Deltaproteobacteria bacterium]